MNTAAIETLQAKHAELDQRAAELLAIAEQSYGPGVRQGYLSSIAGLRKQQAGLKYALSVLGETA